VVGVSERLPDAVRITLVVTGALEKVGATYVVGGSLASSLHGIPRATNDADIVAALRNEHVDPFVGALSETFYVDRDMILDAIAHRHEFNVIEAERPSTRVVRTRATPHCAQSPR
jgi:hypothetical protein